MATVMRLIALLAQLLEPLRFFKHAYERKVAEAAAAREHMIEMMESVMARQEATAKAHAEALTAFANAQAKQSEAMQTWFELFKHSNETARLETSTVRPEDEWAMQDERELQALIEAGFPINGTDEQKRQWLMAL